MKPFANKHWRQNPKCIINSRHKKYNIVEYCVVLVPLLRGNNDEIDDDENRYGGFVENW